MRAMYGVLGNKVVIALTGWLIPAAYLALNWSAATVAAFGLARQLDAPVQRRARRRHHLRHRRGHPRG
ncbi:hypothetical protein [Streptomyces sp. NRRL B-24720]|uniref:hypothetical protein n=1 Tax=Streptomyces sp. NRRL B-24720 TaxID=1476876 RepID=UPI000ADA317A|nr:hypothetical protein [Streptomyces sp. NRRL B-24720]